MKTERIYENADAGCYPFCSIKMAGGVDGDCDGQCGPGGGACDGDCAG